MSAPLTELPDTKLTEAEERLLAQKIQAGDLEAQNALVMHNMRDAISYSRRATNGAIPDGQLASVCYDVLYRGAKRFNPKFGRFFAFCKAGLRGWCVNIWKDQDVVKGGALCCEFEKQQLRIKKHGDSTEPWDDRDIITPDHEIAEPDFKGILIRERWELVQQVMKKVCSVRERQIIHLTYASGFSFPETGRYLGLTRAAIQAAHSKALRKIRGHLFAKRRLYQD